MVVLQDSCTIAHALCTALMCVEARAWTGKGISSHPTHAPNPAASRAGTCLANEGCGVVDLSLCCNAVYPGLHRCTLRIVCVCRRAHVYTCTAFINSCALGVFSQRESALVVNTVFTMFMCTAYLNYFSRMRSATIYIVYDGDDDVETENNCYPWFDI